MKQIPSAEEIQAAIPAPEVGVRRVMLQLSEPGTTSGDVNISAVRAADGKPYVRVIFTHEHGLGYVDLAVKGEPGNVAEQVGKAIVAEARRAAAGLWTPST